MPIIGAYFGWRLYNGSGWAVVGGQDKKNKTLEVMSFLAGVKFKSLGIKCSERSVLPLKGARRCIYVLKKTKR